MSDYRPTADPELRLTGVRVAIVASTFNNTIVEGLVTGARATLMAHGVAESHISVTWVPGAWELPLMAAHLADTEQYDAIIALGAVIRGGTPHFEYVCSGCTTGLMQVQQEFGMPVGFGVLTCDDLSQAETRSAPGEGNKGAESALAVLAMVKQLRALDV